VCKDGCKDGYKLFCTLFGKHGVCKDGYEPFPAHLSRIRRAQSEGMALLPLLLLAAFSAARLTDARCSIQADTDVVVYSATGAGGVGEFSDKWTRSFFGWWSAANPGGGLNVDFITDSTEISLYYSNGCQLSDAASYPRLKLWVQPGGSADNQSTSLGPGGRDNILNFAASANGHYMGTCAGWYYAAGSYWWFNDFFPEAWMPHWWPTVEGPISAIAVYPAYSPTPVHADDGTQYTMIYYGGPATGLTNATGSQIPNGASVLAQYAATNVPQGIPAVVNYQGRYVKALFNSPHPEAEAGVGLQCDPPLPAGCITAAQQLQNWRFLASNINNLLGTSWTIPSSL
jgi:hypothetical protein